MNVPNYAFGKIMGHTGLPVRQVRQTLKTADLAVAKRKAFEYGDPSIRIFADDGGQIFGGHGMRKDNQLKTAAGLSKLWDASR